MKFLTIKFKNFLSFGNSVTEVDLNTNKLIHVSGTNGCGKSSILESVYYAFTGKPYRKIQKPKLINNINNKNLYVELELEHMGSRYIIKRGMKPNIFEIYKNGELVSEDSHIKDYQIQLEMMMGLDAKTFKQTIIMSSRYYTPFLDLSKNEKRDFIENIFSIKIFSEMNDTLKRGTQSIKSQIKELNKDVEHVKSNIKLLSDINDKRLSELNIEKENVELEIEKLEKDNNKLVVDNESLQSQLEQKNEELKNLNNKIKLKHDIEKKINVHQYKINTYVERIEFFTTNDVCKMCNQEIDVEFKEEKINYYKQQKQEIDNKVDELKVYIEKIEELNKIYQEVTSLVTEVNKHIINNNSTITHNMKSIMKYKEKLNQLTESTVDETNLNIFKEKLDRLNKEKLKSEKMKKYVLMTIDLLSEKGIKKFIIEKYIPVFNTILNKYLKSLEAQYSVMFDNEFEVNIIARGYEDLGYYSLSSGEKQRLDTALVFSFLELCKLKNSVDTNVIFFDEILDASLDQQGLEGVLKIFQSLKSQGYTIFVVSHRDNLEGFEQNMKISKKRFSEIEYV